MSTEKSSSLNSFSSRLKFLRAERKKAEFARFIGVSPPLYHQWENGATPTYDKALLISKKCNVDIEWLLTGVENTIGHRLAASYNIHHSQEVKESSPCENCKKKDHEIDQLRADLREARAVIRDQASALAAALVLKPSSSIVNKNTKPEEGV